MDGHQAREAERPRECGEELQDSSRVPPFDRKGQMRRLHGARWYGTADHNWIVAVVASARGRSCWKVIQYVLILIVIQS